MGTALWLACIFGGASNLYALSLSLRDRGIRGRGREGTRERGRWRGRERGPLSWHLSSLALADLLYLSTAPFTAYAALYRDWPFGPIGCCLLLTLDLVSMHAGIFTLTALCAVRYRAIARPLAARRGVPFGRRGILAPWVAALAITLPLTLNVKLERRSTEDENIAQLCSPRWNEDENRLYLTLLFISSVLAPGLVIIGLYAGLARAYYRRRAEGDPRQKPRSKVVILISGVVLTYWLCFLPFWLWQLVPLYLEVLPLSFHTQGVVNEALALLTYANSCLDPFLYTLLVGRHKERAPRATGRGVGNVVPRREIRQQMREGEAQFTDSRSQISLARAPFSGNEDSIPEIPAIVSLSHDEV
ncbi:urotensin-2 receptor-like [Rhinoraja longicauda]